MNRMVEQEPRARAEKQRVTLLSTYVAQGSVRYRVSCDGIAYDVNDREFRLLQWGRDPCELGLKPEKDAR